MGYTTKNEVKNETNENNTTTKNVVNNTTEQNNVQQNTTTENVTQEQNHTENQTQNKHLFFVNQTFTQRCFFFVSKHKDISTK